MQVCANIDGKHVDRLWTGCRVYGKEVSGMSRVYAVTWRTCMDVMDVGLAQLISITPNLFTNV